VLTNGNFEAGVTGWTSFVTANGTITDPPSPPVGAPTSEQATTALFNVTGSGASNALFLNAGAKSFIPGGPQEGGGVTQTFSTTGGVATFSANIAAWTSNTVSNLGLLSVLLDGVLMDSHDFANAPGQPTTLLSTLGFTTELSAGSHTLTLLATRQFAPSSGVTHQYFDNVSLDVAQTPLPAALPMFISGLGVVGALWRRNAKRKAAATAAA